MKIRKIHFSAEAGTLIAVLILANLRTFLFFSLFPSVSFFPLGLAWVEIGFWLAVSIITAISLARNNLFSAYWMAWRSNWILGVFAFLALVSLLWSISPSVTLFRWLEFFSATTLAFYIGIRCDLRRSLALLAWSGAYLAFLSLLLALFAPALGTMPGYPYYGAWRGLFWHRNHLGSLMALFNLVYLFQVSINLRKDKGQALFWGFFYLLALSLVFLSRSATGVILLVLLNLAFAILLGWMRFRSHLQRRHYYIFGIGLLAVVVIAFLNLDFLFGLLGRNTTLTGRMGLWNYLLQEMVARRPFLGYGFGSIWNDESFRLAASQAVGWPFAVLIGDNGFMDILLHLGAVGLAIFLGVIGLACVRAVKFALAEQTLVAFFPLFFMAYALVANISFSLFIETEVFIWMLIVFMLYAANPKGGFPSAG